MKKKLVLVPLLFAVCVSPSISETRFMMEYGLFKPHGSFSHVFKPHMPMGYDFSNGDYYGVKFRQKLGWILSLQANAGVGFSSVGLAFLHPPLAKRTAGQARVDVRVISFRPSLEFAPRDVVLTPYFLLGPEIQLRGSKIPNETAEEEALSDEYKEWDMGAVYSGGSKVNPVEYPTFDGFSFSWFMGFGLRVWTATKTEMSLNFSFHHATINLGKAHWDEEEEEFLPDESTFQSMIMTVGFGKGW